MPKADQLPSDLKEFAERQGFEIRYHRFRSDVQSLCLSLKPNEPRGKWLVIEWIGGTIAGITAALICAGILSDLKSDEFSAV